MKMKDTIISKHDIEYKKVPHMGISTWLAIIGVLFIIGLSAYYKYFMGKETLTCKKESTIILSGNNTPYKVSYKLSFKDKIYVSGNLIEEYNLSKLSSDIKNIIINNNLCGKNIISNTEIYKYSVSNCKQEVKDDLITIKSNFDIENITGDVKIKDVKESFKKEGYKCEIDK